jgi:uncharacterized BrkB/YihY/UPF0761 family membrane protein
MTWLYWTSFVLLVGAEVNAELAKESKQGSIEPKETPLHDKERGISPSPFDRAA